jgi:HD-GYP domain-containing protein (c-di-GMP phosphodiesterase class II)
MVTSNQKLIHTFAALADLGQEVADTESFSEMIRTSLHLLLGSLAIRRGGIAKFNDYEREMNFMAIRGLGDEFPLNLRVTNRDERDFLQIGLTTIEINKPIENSIVFVNRYRKIFAIRQIKMLIPLVVREELVGLIFLGKKATDENFTHIDKDIITALARHIGVGILQRNLMLELEHRAEENLKLYENLKKTYTDTVKSFAAAIDCKDKYTQGHSTRVGKYSEIIAEELGFDENRVEGIAIAGYLHDVGKLIVDRSIINSPVRINAKESAELNRHPGMGYEILAPIQHPYADIPLAAKYHHERLDGRGYPDGLRDKEIPYIAKIVNLADSFDAMTTDRPYKRRRPAEEVIEDMRRNAGTQFEPEIVTAFCRAILKEVTGETKEKRILKLLGKGYVEAEKVIPILKNALNNMNGTSSLTFVVS